MLRRATTALLVVGLMGAYAGLASAQTPSPDPAEAGQHVEVSSLGVSVTFPPGWEIHDADPAGPAASAATSYPASSCGVQATAMPSGSTLDEFALEIADELDVPDDYEVLGVPEPVDLPVGPAWVIDLLLEIEDPRGPSRGTWYLFGVGDRTVNLVCATEDRPADDWLAIAASIEPLQAAVPSQRIELPEAGFAVTLPDDWTAFTRADLDLRAMIETAGCSDEICVAMVASALAAGDEGIIKLVAIGPPGPSSSPLVEACVFTSWPDAISLEGQLPLLVEAIRTVNGDLLMSGPDAVTMQLSTGAVVRVDHAVVGISVRLPVGEDGWADKTIAVPGGIHGSTYTRTNEQAVYNIICKSGEPPPDDRWLSIAETFEFLPAQ